MWSIVVAISILIESVISSTKYSVSLSITDDYYPSIDIDVGTPSQTITVLLDSTSNTTFVMTNNTENLNSKQDYFVTSDSYTFTSLTDTFTYTYENATTNGTEGKDTIIVSGINITSMTFGLADYNQELFEDEKLGGALSLSRNSDFIKNFKTSNDIDVYKIIIDIDSEKLHFGDYSANQKNSTEVDVYAPNSNLSDYWSFSISSLGTDDIASLFSCDDNCYGVIDAGSPYLTFSMSSTEYSSLFKNIGGKSNCYESTLKCDDKDDIASYIEFTIGNNSFYISRDDFYYDSKIHLQWTDELVDDGMVIFFGKPWLETLQIGLNVNNDTLSFIYTKSSSNSAEKWETVWITAICVIAFALIFFGLFFWKFKIPPPTRTNVQNEEQALLQGQPQVAQPHQPLGQPAPQPRQMPAPEPAQAVGSASGNAASADPDEIRRRRLQFLASQQQDEETGN